MIRDHAMEVLVAVDELVYAIWSLSDGTRSLAAVCAVAAAQRRLPEVQLHGAILSALSPLLEANALILDRVSGS